jgi:hypothetical protein
VVRHEGEMWGARELRRACRKDGRPGVSSRGGGFTPCAAAEAVKPRLLLHPPNGAPRSGAAAPPASHALQLTPAPPAPGAGAHAPPACAANRRNSSSGTEAKPYNPVREGTHARAFAAAAARRLAHAPAWRLGHSARAARLAASGPTRPPWQLTGSRF